jgi:hypothetical protein
MAAHEISTLLISNTAIGHDPGPVSSKIITIIIVICNGKERRRRDAKSGNGEVSKRTEAI